MGGRPRRWWAARAAWQFVDRLRQGLYPKEFRIAAPAWDEEWLSTLEQLLRPPSSATPAAAAPVAEDAPTPARVRMFAELGTGLWRVRQQLIDPKTGDPLEGMRLAHRHLESVWDALARAGVEVQDHTGLPFDPGQALRVIHYQRTADVDHGRVTETLKPTIYLHGRSIQMGDVIVAVPEASDEEASDEEASDGETSASQ